jgi:hypothetical protein
MANDVNFNITIKIIIWQLTNYANIILRNYIIIFLINFDVSNHSNFEYIILLGK